jgi:hypothetical protein
VVSESVTANYFALRKAHFRFTLKSWFRGLDKAAIAAVAEANGPGFARSSERHQGLLDS